ncbi:MAG: protein gvpG [Nanoarchaeota archaeon]|nr:protein gvpG [Nanoarchaeota archaeon]
MVLVVDDLILTITVRPFVFIFKQVHQHALREMYPLEKIQNVIKENRMEYELKEISKEEYGKGAAILEEKLKVAKKVREMYSGTDVLSEVK